MFIISKQDIEGLIHRLNNSGDLEQCRDEVRKMLEIESELLWWAQSGKCCRWQAGAYFTGNTHLLKDVLNALTEGNTAEASSLLREYASELDENKDRIIRF